MVSLIPTVLSAAALAFSLVNSFFLYRLRTQHQAFKTVQITKSLHLTNTPHADKNHTSCSKCGHVVARFFVDTNGNHVCANCDATGFAKFHKA